MLPQLARLDPEDAKRLLKGCGGAHYDDLNMQATVAGFRGRMDDFLSYLSTKWGWVVEHDRDRGVILVNENKPSCVCPLLPKDKTTDLGVLCYCSEGFAERMFSEVSQSKVRAEVTESILRGQKSCKYRIELGVSGA